MMTGEDELQIAKSAKFVLIKRMVKKSWTQINAEKRGFLPLDQRLSA